MGSETLAVEELRRELGMTKQEAAQMLGVSLRTSDRLIALNELKVRRLGRRVLVPRRPLESLMHRATDRSSGQRLWFQECFEHLGAFRQVG